MIRARVAPSFSAPITGALKPNGLRAVRTSLPRMMRRSSALYLGGIQWMERSSRAPEAKSASNTPKNTARLVATSPALIAHRRIVICSRIAVAGRPPAAVSARPSLRCRRPIG
ncbi:MAG: hypothetical protein HYY38_04490 [Rhodospirillales bacterium]|nr:hypothetical protein [Rhodospirillales bacterium]